MENKRYFWLQLHEDFFDSKRIKKLRKFGSDFVIIYLKLQLLSLQDRGYIEFTGLEETIAKELELEIDEDADKIQFTLSYLQSCGLLQYSDENVFFLPYVEICTGSETASTRRSQKSRAKKSVAMQQNCNALATNCNGEIEKEKEIYKEIEIEIEGGNTKRKRFVPPTLEELESFIFDNNLNVQADTFLDYYESKGWMIGKNHMKDWKAAVRNWSRRQSSFAGNKTTQSVEDIMNL